MTIVIDEGGREAVFHRAGPSVTIGRDRDNSVVIPAATVSSHHIELRSSQGVLRACDLGSLNGTAVLHEGSSKPEALAPHRPRELVPGDVILLGAADAPIRVTVVPGTRQRAGKDRGTIRATRPVASANWDRIDRGSWPKLLDVNRKLLDAEDADRALAIGLEGILSMISRAAGSSVVLFEPGATPGRFRVARIMTLERGARGALEVTADRAGEVLPEGPVMERLLADHVGVLWSDSRHGASTRSLAGVSLRIGREMIGVLLAEARGPGAPALTEPDLDKVMAQAAPLALALRNTRRLAVVSADRARLATENTRLRDAIMGERPVIVGDCEGMRTLREMISRVAATTLPVLVTGETGTGKELVARVLHHESPRRKGPFVASNVAALPASLMESELFGVSRGAYTGAGADRPGLFEAANGGTLFLDEVAELTPPAQATLLRVLQEGELRRLGETRTRKVDVRVVSATNMDLAALVAGGRFRRDLFFRINAVVLNVPPLRDRAGDLDALVEHLLALACAGQGRQPPAVSAEVREAFAAFSWPGNVRQLANELGRAVALTSPGEPLELGTLSPEIARASARPAPRTLLPPRPLKEAMDEFERSLITAALEAHGGNRTRAAEELGITRVGLQKMIRRHGIDAKGPG